MGYTPADARARVCQDVILKAIAKSSLSRNVTIKGGVVMRSVTRNVRRATQDMDIDFIRYSLSDESIDLFINKINCVEGVEIVRVGEIEELRSLLKFGPLSTRHKDIYDLYYHSYNVDILKLKNVLKHIFSMIPG